MELDSSLKSSLQMQPARSQLSPIQVNSHPAPHLIVIVVKGRWGHSLSVINDTLVACGGGSTGSGDTKTSKSCILWKKGQDGWEDFHTLR